MSKNKYQVWSERHDVPLHFAESFHGLSDKWAIEKFKKICEKKEYEWDDLHLFRMCEHCGDGKIGVAVLGSAEGSERKLVILDPPKAKLGTSSSN